MKLKRFAQEHLGATSIAGLVALATTVQLGAFKLAMDEYADRTLPRAPVVAADASDSRGHTPQAKVAARSVLIQPHGSSAARKATNVPDDAMNQGRVHYERSVDTALERKIRPRQPAVTGENEVALAVPVRAPEPPEEVAVAILLTDMIRAVEQPDTAVVLSPVTEPVRAPAQPVVPAVETAMARQADGGQERATPVRSTPGLKVAVLSDSEARPVETAVKPVKRPPAAMRPAKELPPAPSAPAQSRPGNEAWLLAQSPTSFTLQLASFIEPGGIDKFVRNHRLEGQLATYETDKRNRHWYVLIKGLFTDRPSAVAASKTLAGKTGVKIWIRPLGDIQAEIGARNMLTAMR